MTYYLNHIQDMIPICNDLLQKKLPSPIALQGDLGAGKTTFVRTFVEQTSIDTIVSSPTFTLMNIYQNEDIVIHHFDLYRLHNLDEVLEWGFEDFLLNCDFAFIEWAEKAWDLIPTPFTLIRIAHGGSPTERILTLETCL